MKRVLSLFIMIFLALTFVVGCEKKVLNVEVEKYNLEDVEDSNDMPEELEGVKDIIEVIDVNIDSNKISEYNIKEIIKSIENINIKTKIIIKDYQGVEIAEVIENNKEMYIDIKENNRNKEKNEIYISNLSFLKEEVERERLSFIKNLKKAVMKGIDTYVSIGDSLSDELLKDNMNKEIVVPFQGTKELDIDSVNTKIKDFKEDTDLNVAYERFIDTHESYKETIKYADEYKKSYSIEDLNKFKTVLLEFKKNTETCKDSIESLK